MRLDEYNKLTYEEYRQQCILKCKLSELLDCNIEPVERYKAMKYMLDKGIYLKSDETKGYKIYPIYGSGHWTQTEWKKYITQIEEDNELTKSIIEILKRLAKLNGKRLYICVGEKFCGEIQSTCKANIEGCAKAAKYFERIIRKKYDELRK